jgi:hypothetical protein
MKKRLGLLPEVLPDPKASRPTGQGPRDRTLKRLQGLLAVAAAGALAGGCGDGPFGYGVVDPMPEPPNCPGVENDLVFTPTWQGGNLVLDIKVRPGSTTRLNSVEPTIGTGALVAWSFGGDVGLVVLTPTPAQPPDPNQPPPAQPVPAPSPNQAASVHFQVQCAQGPTFVTASLLFAGTGAPVQVQATSSAY